MNRDEWIERCAKRYQIVAGVTIPHSIEMAKACAEMQADDQPVDEWYPPEDAANEDIDCWDGDD